MPRKGENIEKSEIFFSFRFNDKTDKTCRGSKKRHPHGCLSSIFALFVSIYCYAYIILYVIVHYVFYYRIYCRIAVVFSDFRRPFSFLHFCASRRSKNTRTGVSAPAHLPPRPGDDSGTIRRRYTAPPDSPLFPDRKTDPKSSVGFFLRG